MQSKSIIIIIIGLLIVTMVGFVLIGLMGDMEEDTSELEQFQLPEFPISDGPIVLPPAPNPQLDVHEEFREHGNTVQVTQDGLYGNTMLSNVYEIMYFEPTGSITILLYAEPLGLARAQAESQLRTILKLSDAEICQLPVIVRVNEVVNIEYSPFELGLSFCEEYVILPLE